MDELSDFSGLDSSNVGALHYFLYGQSNSARFVDDADLPVDVHNERHFAQTHELLLQNRVHYKHARIFAEKSKCDGDGNVVNGDAGGFSLGDRMLNEKHQFSNFVIFCGQSFTNHFDGPAKNGDGGPPEL